MSGHLDTSSAVHLHVDPRDEGSLVTCQVTTSIGNVLGRRATTEWDGRHERLAVLLRVGFAQKQMCPGGGRAMSGRGGMAYGPGQGESDYLHARAAHHRRYRVEADLLRTVLDGHGLGEGACQRPCRPESGLRVFPTLVALMTAALDALYQVRLGRGRTPAVEATWRKQPGRPRSRK